MSHVVLVFFFVSAEERTYIIIVSWLNKTGIGFTLEPPIMSSSTKSPPTTTEIALTTDKPG